MLLLDLVTVQVENCYYFLLNQQSYRIDLAFLTWTVGMENKKKIYENNHKIIIYIIIYIVQSVCIFCEEYAQYANISWGENIPTNIFGKVILCLQMIC